MGALSMKRRELLQSLAAMTAMHAIPLAAHAATLPPWAIGFEGVDDDLARMGMSLEGSIPESCLGTLYRNGPALYARAGRRYEHWFDPDGMIQAYRLGRGGVEHAGRFVRTRKFKAESEAGRFLYGGAGTNFDDQLPVRNNEDTNVANINVQPLNGELLALWEAGSAYRIDPETLETKGQETWSGQLRGVPFSAHPHFDEHGELWNIGSVPFAGRPLLVLYHVGADGKLRKSRMHQLDFAGYMHDFVLTPRYLIALNSSAVFGEGSSFVDSMGWQGDRASQLLVFDRNDFSLRATIEVPATFVFHFGNAWEEAGGEEVCFTACAYEDNQIVRVGMRRFAGQRPGPYENASELVRYKVSVGRQRASVESLGVDMEFPSFDKRAPFTTQPLLGAGGQNTSAASLASAVVRVDPRTGEREAWDYGPGVIVEEPLFVPGPDGGHAVHTFLDYERKRSGVAILAATRLADGPVALATMNRVMPLGFHGCFV